LTICFTAVTNNPKIAAFWMATSICGLSLAGSPFRMLRATAAEVAHRGQSTGWSFCLLTFLFSYFLIFGEKIVPEPLMATEYNACSIP
jgi:hypothetical protein